jgi:hypothetical protein
MVRSLATGLAAAQPGETPMSKKLAVMALFALSLGTTVASFATSAHAAFDAYMYFQDDNDYYLSGETQ